MPRNFLFGAAALALLAGCGPGLPFAQHSDPNAAEVVEQTETLVQDCQTRFKTWLGATDVVSDTGPSITRTGDTTSIRLVAQPTGPDAIDPVQYSCDYDNGQFITAGPVQ